MTSTRRLRRSFAATFLIACAAASATEEDARIGEVIVRVEPIFGADEGRLARPIFRLADELHVDTREETVRAHLLFKSGDPYSQRVLDETARNLREQRYIREPIVRPIAVHDGVVDVEVVVQDVWTTNPGASFGRAGGENSSGIEFEELNLLGFGKQVSLGFKSDAERTSYTAKWHDPSMLGSRWVDTIAVTRSDDGRGYELALERPFFSLDARWSAGVSAAHGTAIDRVYSLGEQVAEYSREADDFDVHVGWSRGLREGVAHRWTTGVRRERVAFTAEPSLRARDLLYPYLRFESLEDDFATARNRDQIARTEDLYFGRRYAIEVGTDLGAAILHAQASRGFRLEGERALFASGELSGRTENGSVADAMLSVALRYYHPTSERSTFFASLGGTLGHRLDADHELILDGELGLRGYPLRYQSGSSRALLTLEERIFTDWSLLHLAKVGGAVFCDAGRAWGPSIGGGESLGMLTDVGFGLRFGNLRSALANVLHLDVAFPLGGDPSIDKVQFLVQTKRSF
jgi:outer membrane translocation and assembly module TamA